MAISARKQGLSNAVFPLYFALEEAGSLDCLPAGKLNCDYLWYMSLEQLHGTLPSSKVLLSILWDS